jgi:hypothetical protein
MDSGKNLGGKAHREFELVVAFENVGLAFPTAKGFPIDKSF